MNPLTVAISALIGYAIGTVQVLALDWFRRRSQHRAQVRLLRAELRRLADLKQPFGWARISGPPSDHIPKPPTPSPNFASLIAAIDFYLTDEHDDDNTQLGLLGLLDGCEVLARYSREVMELVDQVTAAWTPASAAKYWNRAFEYTEEYDRELARFQTIVSSALEDVERRLKEITFRHQVRRPIGRLPVGRNPDPV